MNLHSPMVGRETRSFFACLVAGLAGAALLLTLYLGILTLLQSAEHALGQLTQDWIWVGLVALGFGTQLGLYVYLRQILARMKLAGATALTGAGTGTSTMGMLACCAHHVTDVAPLIGLAGTSGLSGVVAFFGEYKIPLILFGLLVNLIGITFSARTIRKERAHLFRMESSQGEEVLPVVPACHQAE